MEGLEAQANEEVLEQGNNGLEVEQQGNDDTLPNLPEATEQGDQQVAETAPEQEYDWTKDERFERMWKNDPNGLYKSYRNLEGQYDKVKPLQANYEGLVSKFEENGLSVDQIDDYLNEYKTLKDPDNPINQDIAVLETFLNDSVAGPQLLNYLKELEVGMMQRQYPNMSQAQIEHQMRTDQELKALKESEFKRQQEMQEQNNLSEINKNTEKFISYAKERGLEVTEEMKNEVWKHCIDNNIPINSIYYAFCEKYDKQLTEALENRMRDNIAKGKSKTDKVAVPSASKTNKPMGGSSQDNLNKLHSVLRGAFGK